MITPKPLSSELAGIVTGTFAGSLVGVGEDSLVTPRTSPSESGVGLSTGAVFELGDGVGDEAIILVGSGVDFLVVIGGSCAPPL